MLSFLSACLAIFTVLYALLIVAYRIWFDKLKPFESINQADENIHFTIVIPARNEALNIKACLNSILDQEYAAEHFEVIVIDDFSEDATPEIVKGIGLLHSNVHLLSLADFYKPGEMNSFKKKAIELAVSKSKGQWIVTTDADCIIPKQWLSLYNAFIQQNLPENKLVFVAAPVMFIKEQGILNEFQVLDFLALQGITAAAVGAGKHSMSNGANLAFEKSAFIAVGGYQGVDQIASGDDMFLMHKMKVTLSSKIGYLFHPDAIVLTKAMSNWKDFIMQRIRWSSKARYYDDNSIFWVLLLVYLYNLSLIVLLVKGAYTYVFISLLIKTGVELFFLSPVAKFYKLSGELLYFPLFQPLHILYTLIAGLFGQVKTYTWKGRRVK
jgi:cellulose synthase/poly-beta-1,6-N-acetylglucosamine synthase-like glycosyltransferase